MMRAIRFSTQLNFSIETNTLASIKSQSERISIVSKERIVEEINKILLSRKPSNGLILMEVTNLLEKTLPWVSALQGVDIVNGNAHKDNFYHSLEVLDKINEHSNNLWLCWTALLHDIGKTKDKLYVTMWVVLSIN
jgi:tRNA nucleotidyltransferase/poly(A) polymerase